MKYFKTRRECKNLEFEVGCLKYAGNLQKRILQKSLLMNTLLFLFLTLFIRMGAGGLVRSIRRI